jgi:hypothetical protein
MGVAVGSGHCRWRELAGRSEWEGGGWSGYSRLLAGEPKGQILADIPKKSYRQVIHTAIIAKGGVVLGSALNIGYYITMYRDEM